MCGSACMKEEHRAMQSASQPGGQKFAPRGALGEDFAVPLDGPTKHPTLRHLLQSSSLRWAQC